MNSPEQVLTHFCTEQVVRVDVTAPSETLTIEFERVFDYPEVVWSDGLSVNALTLEEVVPSLVPPGVSSMAVQLDDDAYLRLPAMTLGDTIAVSAWVRVGTLWDGEVGITLFNSFESDGCGDTDVCRNAVDTVLDRDGWFAFGNDVEGGHAADLWTANTVYDQATSRLFWEGARDEWMMVTLSVSGSQVRVFRGDTQHGSALLNTRLPRMLRQSNYIGACHHAPYQQKARGIHVAMAIADFRLFDRSLSASEVSALFADPASECCIGAGLKDAFGIHDLDLSLEVLRIASPSAVIITPSEPPKAGSDPSVQACETAVTVQQLDICGEIRTTSDCTGDISDGVGSYGNSVDCELKLEGFIGSTYSLKFDEFDTEAELDWLKIYDGASAEAPLVAELSGTALPAQIVSTGRTLYLHFHTNDNTAGVGFRASFSCVGVPLEYWRPSSVAVPLEPGIISQRISQADSSTACLSDVLMSVQCCADAIM
jgi:hypothetical protein